jgi:hypothetical protein
MTDIPPLPKAADSETQRAFARYEASVRLSVAPMMDWTDRCLNYFKIRKL